MLPKYPTEGSLLESQQAFLASLRPGQLMDALFDAIPGAYYFVKDADSRFMGGSLSFARTLGESSVEGLIGKTDYDYSPDFLADAFYEDDRSVLETGIAISDKIELVPSADGSLDWLCTTKMPLCDSKGAIVGLAGVARIIRDTDAVYSDHPEMHLIVDHVRAHYREKLSTADMAKIGGISVSKQERLFRKIFGLTPLMYLQKTRLNAACALLRSTDTDLSKIAVECGFNDQTNMTRAFRLELKITPLKYRRRFGDTKPKRRSATSGVVLFSKV
ncbi:MAG: AraC family transcriptional regulator [Opitutales bacterium]|jgi:AraC-like DNA-binding protein|nr:AraC family transcriptional regulator [Opitutales bacterium]MDP4643415.1 AraC family transcriptional regulator [Opitutales bacterium]MDP4777781.1 AraC family transcriptional regulator [Opitutales bacterium]MDP4879644.1 AraC family transcriptional regulator [Opitutales bacterium]MDP4883997.1 AraC family transcriptional regulator [Opitutales bacterium]